MLYAYACRVVGNDAVHPGMPFNNAAPPPQGNRGPLASQDAGGEADQAGRGGTCEQDGAHHLGADGEGGELPRAAGDRRGRWIGPEPRKAASRGRTYDGT